jgi:hypothetical protein
LHYAKPKGIFSPGTDATNNNGAGPGRILMALTKSHVAGPATPAVREMTFGDLLRKAAEAAPDRLA